jgi:hypothetical protein
VIVDGYFTWMNNTVDAKSPDLGEFSPAEKEVNNGNCERKEEPKGEG